MKNSLKLQQIETPYFLAIAISIAIYIPFMMLGGGIHAIIHDQFDGDLLTYIINARCIFLSELPQFLDGTKSSLTMPAPGFIILFLLFKPLTAYKILQLTSVFVGATGMYFLAKKLGASPLVRIAMAVMFVTIPFYPVYGLSVMGTPLLVYALIDMAERKRFLFGLTVSVLYAAFSSLVLVGYGIIILLMGVVIILFALRKKESAKRLLIATLCIGIVYGLTNLDLVINFLKPTTLAHRNEFVSSAIPFKDAFRDMLQNGTYHEGSVHYRIHLLAPPMVAYCLGSLLIHRILQKKNQDKEKYVLLFSYAVVLGISLFYGFWHCTKMTNFKNSVGGIFTSFQFDRFYFLNPLFWYVLLTSVLVVIAKDSKKAGRIAAKIGIIVQILIIAWCGKYNIDNNVSLRSDWQAVASDSKINLFSDNVSSVTWDDFWDTANFNDIDSYIGHKYGLKKEEYKVVSVGMYPSVPLYNGFYCADGYSNNYTLSHKHRFGKMISPELEKSASLSSYFNNWGNRCYVFSSELTGYYYDKDSKSSIMNLSLAADAIKDLDISFIISAVPINNYEDNKLDFEQEFVADSANYHLYLYKYRE